MEKKLILLNKTQAIVIFIVFLMISLFPAIQSLKINNDGLRQVSETQDRIPILKQIGPVGTFEEYISSREDKPFFIEKISENTERGESPLVIIFVEADLVSDLEDEIILYNQTLRNAGYYSCTYQVSGVDPQDLKDTIINTVQSGYNVTGAVLVGDLPVEWFHHKNDFYGASEFPCDLYLMDLDGTWSDLDEDGMYDSHTNGSGDTAPEIYVGRIDASNVPGDEILILEKYFSKVNDFWSGATNQTKYGLTYTDEDWAEYDDFKYDLGYAYEDYEAIWYPDVYRSDYVDNRIPGTYEFIQLSCHSSSQVHAFTSGGYASNDEIRDAPPNALFYNLFCCSSLRFTDYNCLGYAYILDTDTPSLTVVGSAKTGSMLDFRYFYEPIGNGDSFGTAFRKWFEYEFPYDDTPGGYNDISWFYGMVILGDPTIIINLDNRPPNMPNIDGPSNGKPGVTYDYKFNSEDSDGNDLRFIIEWGDNASDTTEYIQSGTDFIISHTWVEEGNYKIKVKAEDVYGSLSPENTYDVNIPRTRASHHPLFLWLFEGLQKLEKLFLLIIGN